MATANIPPPSSAEDISRWILEFENAQNAAASPVPQWADQAIFELRESPVGEEMSKIRDLRHESGMLDWPWDQFKVDLQTVVDRIARDIFILDKTRQLKAIGHMIQGGIALALPIVAAVGFRTKGVAAGSLAASVQSTVYGGATTGVFSFLQSVGAKAGPVTAGAVISGIESIAAGATALAGRRDDEDVTTHLVQGIDNTRRQIMRFLQ